MACPPASLSSPSPLDPKEPFELVFIKDDGSEVKCTVDESFIQECKSLRGLFEDTGDRSTTILESNLSMSVFQQLVVMKKDQPLDSYSVDNLVDLLIGANYLEHQFWVHRLAKRIADLITNKSSQEIREIMKLQQTPEFSEKEKKEIQEKYGWMAKPPAGVASVASSVAPSVASGQ